MGKNCFVLVVPALLILTGCFELLNKKEEEPEPKPDLPVSVRSAIDGAIAHPRSVQACARLYHSLKDLPDGDTRDTLACAVGIGGRLNDRTDIYEKMKRHLAGTLHTESLTDENLSETCATCSGRSKNQTEKKCSTCNGHGLCRISNCYRGYCIPYKYIKTNANMRDGRFNRSCDESKCKKYFNAKYHCMDCKGTGKCEECGGTGKQVETRSCSACRGKGREVTKSRMEEQYLFLLQSIQ